MECGMKLNKKRIKLLLERYVKDKDFSTVLTTSTSEEDLVSYLYPKIQTEFRAWKQRNVTDKKKYFLLICQSANIMNKVLILVAKYIRDSSNAQPVVDVTDFIGKPMCYSISKKFLEHQRICLNEGSLDKNCTISFDPTSLNPLTSIYLEEKFKYAHPDLLCGIALIIECLKFQDVKFLEERHCRKIIEQSPSKEFSRYFVPQTLAILDEESSCNVYCKMTKPKLPSKHKMEPNFLMVEDRGARSDMTDVPLKQDVNVSIIKGDSKRSAKKVSWAAGIQGNENTINVSRRKYLVNCGTNSNKQYKWLTKCDSSFKKRTLGNLVTNRVKRSLDFDLRDIEAKFSHIKVSEGTESDNESEMLKKKRRLEEV